MKNVRLFFKKKDRLRYISHLDLNRMMSRFIRMAKLPVWYTEGFHPRPYIVLVSALSLGFESEFEAVDFRLMQDVPFKEIEKRMGDVFPDGLEVIRAAQPVYKVSEIAYSAYEIKGKFDFDVEKVMQDGELVAEKKNKKGKVQSVNLSDGIKSYDYQDGVLTAILMSSNQGSVNPNALIEALERKSGTLIEVERVKRTMLYTAGMDGFQ